MNINNQNAGAQQSQSNSSNSNRVVVPEAKGALDQMKYEIASELGINLKKGYNGDLPSRQAGYIGGYMTNILLPGRRSQSALSTTLPVIRRIESFGVLPSISMSIRSI
ncbi:MAG: alpha/beta-type small acid-soluble spore protein [Clostridia bacterium]|nr:alpha/beta-type small acid-soluble spore protein [Clostridia bacterium]